MFLQEFLVVFLGNFTVVIIEFGLMIPLCGRYILFVATRGRVRLWPGEDEGTYESAGY